MGGSQGWSHKITGDKWAYTVERGVLDNDAEATEGCKHETILVEYVPNVNGDPRKMQPLIILSLDYICAICPVFIFRPLGHY